LESDKCRTIRRGRETGAWLSILTSTINGMELSAQEFRDAISMRYGDKLLELSTNCCKKGGLVIFCHNEIQDKLVHMAGKVMPPSALVALQCISRLPQPPCVLPTHPQKMKPPVKTIAVTSFSKDFGPEVLIA
jgi:hypothetical protein